MSSKPDLPLEAVAALHRGQKIQAIKVVRAHSGVDLKEAKQRVEEYVRSEPALAASFAEREARVAAAVRRWGAVALIAAALAALWWNA